jgi:transcriptional regulator with GAF, ATPase, and Fis domain
LSEAIARGAAEVDLRFTVTGKPRWRHLMARRLDVRGRPYVVTVGIDITERLETADRLAAALAEVTRLRDQLQNENVILREEVEATRTPGAIGGHSPAITHALAQVGHVAPTDATVLLLGETGVGKELFATAIHQGSPRRDRPMVRVNCAAMPPALIESELFGREKGAYTGALSRQIGRFELAAGSTIFLDEVGELTLEAQAKLLRVLESREVERLGSPTPVSVDVRVVAATNRDLAAEVRAGRFRADLFYRLNVFPIAVPPLRDRLEDVPELVWHFVEQLGKTMAKRIDAIPQADMEALARYSWPGNIRELRNLVERSMIVATGPQLRLLSPIDTQPTASPPSERERILTALERSGWRVRGPNGAAAALGLKPTTLETKMLRLGIRRPGRNP